MFDKIISPYADSDKTMKAVDMTSGLGQFALEFCHAFNVKISEIVANGNLSTSLRVLTQNGYEAGSLAMGRDRDGTYYVYKSPLIGKEKSSKRSSRDERDASKIAGVIAAVKRNKEQPNEVALSNLFIGPISYASGSIERSGRNDLAIHLSSAEVLSTIEYVLGHKADIAFQPTKTVLEEKYLDYQRRLTNKDACRDIYKRFMEGSYAVGVRQVNGPDGYAKGHHYLVGEVALKPGSVNPEFTVMPKRYATLAEHPDLCSVVPIIRTYFQGKSGHNRNNELAIGACDEYFDEIDVAVGYNDNKMIWMLIPKRGA